MVEGLIAGELIDMHRNQSKYYQFLSVKPGDGIFVATAGFCKNYQELMIIFFQPFHGIVVVN